MSNYYSLIFTQKKKCQTVIYIPPNKRQCIIPSIKSRIAYTNTKIYSRLFKAVILFPNQQKKNNTILFYESIIFVPQDEHH